MTAVFGVGTAWLFRGGLFLRAFGIEVVTNIGVPASRLRTLWRGLLAWSPVIIALGLLALNPILLPVRDARESDLRHRRVRCGDLRGGCHVGCHASGTRPAGSRRRDLSRATMTGGSLALLSRSLPRIARPGDRRAAIPALRDESSRRQRLRLTSADRMLWAWLSQRWHGWRAALHVVQPATVLAWHRRGFRLFWTWKSRHRTGRPGAS